MITVYKFKVYNPATDTYAYPERLSPAERIASIPGAQIVPGHEKQVREEQLDAHGRFDPLSG